MIIKQKQLFEADKNELVDEVWKMRVLVCVVAIVAGLFGFLIGNLFTEAIQQVYVDKVTTLINEIETKN